MKKSEIRRSQLKKWFEKRSLPSGEKSYFSQIITGKSALGEKAAARIEMQYGMPKGYLDGLCDLESHGDGNINASLRSTFAFIAAGLQSHDPLLRKQLTLIVENLVMTPEKAEDLAGLFIATLERYQNLSEKPQKTAPTKSTPVSDTVNESSRPQSMPTVS